ncbi:MAG: 50S ribosomal protein L17 [Spirochaetaceae bacterium]|nr:50S ribosomal protein L17 [Spirochaetaceae bacterium]
MNHRSGFNALSRKTAHRKAMLRNLVTSLFRSERITTTKAKALEARRFAEKLITRGKVDSVHNRRQAARFLFDDAMVAKLFTDIGPRMKDRNGGYTRILKLGYRNHDNAEIVLLELVDYEDTHDLSGSDGEKASKKDAAKKASKPKKAGKADEKAEKADKEVKSTKKAAAKSEAPKKAKAEETEKVSDEVKADVAGEEASQKEE